MHVVCERALRGQGKAARKVVWGCQGEAWGLSPKDRTGRRLLVPNVTSPNVKTVLILGEILRNSGMNISVKGECEVSVCECEHEYVCWM